MSTFSSSGSSNDPPPPPPSLRPPPSFWTHEETISLIENYSEKWQSLDRGDLSVADWQSVADSIAWQCEQDPPLKTATLCMNKVEELLKRYWKERFKTSSSWPYFWFLDAMEIVPPDNVRSMRFRPG